MSKRRTKQASKSPISPGSDAQTTVWSELGFLLFGVLILYGAYLILWEGQVPTRHSNGYHTFDGIERVVGLMPLAFGGFVVYLFVGKLYRRACRLLGIRYEDSS